MANFDEIVASANKGNLKKQLFLGELYLSKNNFEAAAGWFTKAAERDDASAQYHLAFLYFKGQGVNKDQVKAADYLKRSAENDYVMAQAQLGGFYMQGHGVGRDEQMGLFWSRKAAVAGNGLAMHNLGIAYFRGLGMSKNLEKARDWLLKAVKNGFTPSKELLLNEAEILRSENDDDDKDYMQRLVATAEEEGILERANENGEDENAINHTNGIDIIAEEKESEAVVEEGESCDEDIDGEENSDEEINDGEEDSGVNGSEDRAENENEGEKVEGFLAKVKKILHKFFVE